MRRWLEPVLIIIAIGLLASLWHAVPPPKTRSTPASPQGFVVRRPACLQSGDHSDTKAGLTVHHIALGETLAETREFFRSHQLLETELDRLGAGNAYIRSAVREGSSQTPCLMVTFRQERVISLEGSTVENNYAGLSLLLATTKLRANEAPALFGNPLQEQNNVRTYCCIGGNGATARLQIAYDRLNRAQRFSLQAWDAEPDPLELPLQE